MGFSIHIRATASSQATYRSPRPQAAGLIHFAARPFKNTAALSLWASSTTSALRCAAVFLLTGVFASALRGQCFRVAAFAPVLRGTPPPTAKWYVGKSTHPRQQRERLEPELISRQAPERKRGGAAGGADTF